MFALACTRHILGRELAEANPLFERLARDRGFYSGRLMADIARTGTVRQLPYVPPDVRAAFVTALEIAPAWHLKMQAAVQRHVDAAVAETINLPAGAAPADVRAIYLTAWRAGSRGSPSTATEPAPARSSPAQPPGHRPAPRCRSTTSAAAAATRTSANSDPSGRPTRQ
jgi:ribonucleotide reductase alpha subunit